MRRRSRYRARRSSDTAGTVRPIPADPRGSGATLARVSVRIVWKDGARWRADDASFAAFARQLDAARDVIVGLDPIVDRLTRLAPAGPVSIDDLALNEHERAVLTAAVHRCAEEVEVATPASLGFERVDDFTRYLECVRALRDLVQTDVTW